VSNMNSQLAYDSNSINYPLSIVVSSLHCVAVFHSASYLSERMVVILLIQTLQPVRFTQNVITTTPSSFSPLQMSTPQATTSWVDSSTPTPPILIQLVIDRPSKVVPVLLQTMCILLAAVIVTCLILKVKQLYHQ
jgi:biotin transporter BioY